MINTTHIGGVSKVFGTKNRIYSAGGNDSVVQARWLNTTTGVWSLNSSVSGVGTSSDTVSAMYVSGNQKRWGVGRSNGDIYILGHPDNSYNWSIANTITGAHTASVNFIRFSSNGWHMISGAAANDSVRLRTKLDNWNTSTNYPWKGQSGDWDDRNKQVTIGLYGNDNGAFTTKFLKANCSAGTNTSDISQCQCPAGQAWFNGGCGLLLCNSTNFTNINVTKGYAD